MEEDLVEGVIEIEIAEGATTAEEDPEAEGQDLDPRTEVETLRTEEEDLDQEVQDQPETDLTQETERDQ